MFFKWIRRKRPREILHCCRKRLMRDPPICSPIPNSRKFMKRARQWDKARLATSRPWRINPQSTLLLSRLALLHAGPLKQPSQAVQNWRNRPGPSRRPALSPPRSVLSAIAAGDYKWAYGLLVEAQRSNPDNAEVRYYSGVTPYASAGFLRLRTLSREQPNQESSRIVSGLWPKRVRSS